MGGSTVTSGMDLNDQLDYLLKRVSQLEQSISDPDVVGTTTVFTSDGSIIVLQITPSPPTSIVLVPGAFMDNIYVDATWTPPVDGTAVTYEIELAKKVAGVYQTQDARRTNGNTIRWNGLEPNTTYGFRVASVSNSQALSAFVPATGYIDITTAIDSTVPAQATGLQVFSGLHTIVARWNDNAEFDVAHGNGVYKVDLANDAAFTTIVKTNYQGGTVTVFSDLAAGTTYYLRIAAIDASGNQGAYSSTQTGTPGQATHNDIAPGVITADLIAAATIVGGNIAASTITGNLIAANTISAHSIKTSSLDVADITLLGGSIRAGNPPTTGLLLNSQGLRFYAGGSATVVLDALSGSASFSGTITASNFYGGMIQGGYIVGGSITAAFIQTNSTTPSVVLDAVTYTNYGSYRRIAFWSLYSGYISVPAQVYSNHSNVLQQEIFVLAAAEWDQHTGTSARIELTNKVYFDFLGNSEITLVAERVTVTAAEQQVQMNTPLVYASSVVSAVSYTTRSSRATKTGIAKLSLPLEKLEKLSPRSFGRKPDESMARYKSGVMPRDHAKRIGLPEDDLETIKIVHPVEHEWGFVAEELQEVFPEMVTEINGELGIHYDFFIPLLVLAVQDLRSRINHLEGSKRGK